MTLVIGEVLGVLFEIINPSDKYTVEAPDLEVAARRLCELAKQRKAPTVEPRHEREGAGIQ